jgi:hypothetical protein
MIMPEVPRGVLQIADDNKPEKDSQIASSIKLLKIYVIISSLNYVSNQEYSYDIVQCHQLSN